MAELDGYRKNIANTPARPRNTNWADEVLGLDSPERPIQSRSLQDEVESYLVEGLYQLGPVRYWEENQLRYPTLFMFALDILPIQGSAVPCERVFSSSAETDTARRNRIAPELMEALQMLKFSIKRGRALNFTQGTTREEELTVLEAVMNDSSLVPEDVTSFNTFIQSLLATEDVTE